MELFFQAADHRHLFLYLDALAANEARGHIAVGECARRSRDEYRNLHKKIEMLESELQREKDGNALLRHQISQESRRAAVVNTLFANMQDDLAAGLTEPPFLAGDVSVCASLYADMAFLRKTFQKTRTFFLLQENALLPAPENPAEAKNELWQRYLLHLGMNDMREIFLCCQKSREPLQTLPTSAASLFSPLPDLQLFFVMLISCLDAVGNAASPGGFDDFIALLSELRELKKKIERGIREQEKEQAELLAVLYAFFKETEITGKRPDRASTHAKGESF